MRRSLFSVSAAVLAAAVLASTPLASAPAAAQQRDSVSVAPAPRLRVDAPVSPGGAFLRALVLPGWGHAAIGSYGRAGFYFVSETTTGFMIARTLHRIGIAEDARDLKESRTREALLASGVPTDSIDLRLAANAEVRHTRNLVEARKSQLQDWAAMGIFLLFIGAADAFVSAHLRDFPAPVGIEATATPAGATAVGIRVPFGGHAPPR